jgi:5-(carboxyamino)imidazole ribonucleotide synthase
MANILGDLWNDAEPDWVAACSHPQVKLHLYGKHQARPGRKMGHMTALGSNVSEAAELVKTARSALTSGAKRPD